MAIVARDQLTYSQTKSSGLYFELNESNLKKKSQHVLHMGTQKEKLVYRQTYGNKWPHCDFEIVMTWLLLTTKPLNTQKAKEYILL